MSGDILTASVGLAGALLGAVVGAWASAEMTKRTNKSEELKRDGVAMFAMQLKLIRIYSNALSLKLDINASFGKADKEKVPNVSMVHQPVANDPPSVRFEIDELFRMSRVGGDNLLNDVAVLDERNNGLVAAGAQYRIQRLALTEAWSGVVEPGGVIITGFTKGESEKYAPRIAMLDDMLKATRDMAADIAADTFKAMIDLQQARADYFGKGFELTLTNLDGVEISQSFKPKLLAKRSVWVSRKLAS